MSITSSQEYSRRAVSYLGSEPIALCESLSLGKLRDTSILKFDRR
jgi:hypothetical protein